MTGAEGLAAAFVGGVLTSASPCVLAAVPVAVGFVGGQSLSPARSWALAGAFVAGMNLALLAMGLAAARLGLLMGSLPGPWSVAVGLIVVALAIALWRAPAAACGVSLPPAWQRRLAASGLGGAVLLGALIGTVMSPCATPALAAALLLAYGIGHSLLLLAAGAMPAAAAALMRRSANLPNWLPGRRSFATLLALAGAWWMLQGLAPEWAAAIMA